MDADGRTSIEPRLDGLLLQRGMVGFIAPWTKQEVYSHLELLEDFDGLYRILLLLRDVFSFSLLILKLVLNSSPLIVWSSFRLIPLDQRFSVCKALEGGSLLILEQPWKSLPCAGHQRRCRRCRWRSRRGSLWGCPLVGWVGCFGEQWVHWNRLAWRLFGDLALMWYDLMAVAPWIFRRFGCGRHVKWWCWQDRNLQKQTCLGAAFIFPLLLGKTTLELTAFIFLERL